MVHTPRNRWLLFTALLVPCLALVTTVALFGYRFLTRQPWAAGTASEPVALGVAAPFPGASPEEVERQVTIPLEVTFAGLPHLKTLRSQSSLGTAALRLQFEGGTDYDAARQEVINRLQFMQQLPAGVVPQLYLGLPEHEVFRYTLAGPTDEGGRPIYTPSDLRTLQDWVVERELRRVPRVGGVEGRGGALKRYEVHPDPDRLGRFGITLRQLQDAIASANRNVVDPGAIDVRGVGLMGGGEDPVARVAEMKGADPTAASARLREEEGQRLREIRGLVVATVNGRPVLVEDVVEGGRLAPGERPGERGVIVGARWQGGVTLSRPRGEGVEWQDEERVEGVVFLRRGEDAEAALRDLRAKVEGLNAAGLLPGARIEPLVERGGRPEDGFWLRADGSGGTTPERLAADLRRARTIVRRAAVAALLTETDGPGAAAPRTGSAAVFVRLQPGDAGSGGSGRLREDVLRELRREFPGVAWSPSLGPPDNFAPAFEGAPGEGLVKVFGRDLAELQEVAGRLDESLRRAQGVEDVRRADGGLAARLDCRVDQQKCRRWGVSADDVSAVIEAALDGKTVSTMIEGDKRFDIRVCWPRRQRGDETAILDIPLDIANNQLVPAGRPPDNGEPAATKPRLRLRDLVSPLGSDGAPDPQGEFTHRGASALYRENGQRFVAVRFRLRDAALDPVREAFTPLIPPGCRAEWIGR